MTTVIDNRMEWYMKHRKVLGVTVGWALNPVIFMSEPKGVLPYKVDRLVFDDFYKHGDDWARCPYTKKKLPIYRHSMSIFKTITEPPDFD